MNHTQLKKFLPAVAFFSGVVWDSLTLTRVDRLTDNVILFLYLLILDGLIVLVNIIERSPEVNLLPLLTKYKQWYPFVIQFLLGGTVQRICCLLFPKCVVHQDGCFLCTVAVPPRYK